MDGNNKFALLSLLPPELRTMIYSKLELKERANMARTCDEAMIYFRKYPIRIQKLYLYASDQDGPPSIRVNFDQTYEEKFIMNEEMAGMLSKELASLAGCSCKWCAGEDFMKHWRCVCENGAHIREMECTCWSDVFTTVLLTDPATTYVRSFPYAGLIDCFQPNGKITRKHDGWRVLFIGWHFTSTEDSADTFRMRNWERWTEFWSVQSVYLDCPTRDIFVNNDIFSVRTVINAESVYVLGRTKITNDQLRLLQGRSLVLFNADVDYKAQCTYFIDKIKQWIENDISGTFEVERRQGSSERTPHKCVVEITQDYSTINTLPHHFETRLHSGFGIHKFTIANLKTGSTLTAFSEAIYCRRNSV